MLLLRALSALLLPSTPARARSRCSFCPWTWFSLSFCSWCCCWDRGWRWCWGWAGEIILLSASRRRGLGCWCWFLAPFWSWPWRCSWFRFRPWCSRCSIAASRLPGHPPDAFIFLAILEHSPRRHEFTHACFRPRNSPLFCRPSPVSPLPHLSQGHHSLCQRPRLYIIRSTDEGAGRLGALPKAGGRTVCALGARRTWP